uniref:CCHC-type domain-containing protein n=1 Tax=Lactuca sativa TaxID=4236 RepID=A0A9R1UDI2_LACSA|nr:hypothetical protein LSAT_V11C900484680 [Lactuca sativa]
MWRVLPFKYHAIMRLKTTLGEAMDEARKIENDIASRDRTTVTFGEKRRGPCNSSTMSCRCCGKMGHRHEDCKSTELMCYKCRQMGHLSVHCLNHKVQMGTSRKKDEVPKGKPHALTMKTDEVIFRTLLINYTCLCVICACVLSMVLCDLMLVLVSIWYECIYVLICGIQRTP